MRPYPVLLVLLVAGVDSGFAQGRISSVRVDPPLDTTDAVTGAIVRTLTAYWHSPTPGYRSGPYWAASELRGGRTYDWTAGDLYFRGLAATVLQITAADSEGRVFVIKTLFTRSGDPPQHIAVQRLYAVRSDSGWTLAGALPRLTADWQDTLVGSIHYRFPPSRHLDHRRAENAAAFVDSLAKFLALPQPGPIAYYLTESTDEMYRIMGFDWHAQPSGPGTGRGGRAGDGTVFVASRAAGEANYHELGHVLLYATQSPRGRQGLIEEGAATWFGGSRGRTYPELVLTLARIHQEHPTLSFARLNELSEADYTVGFYATGALICDAVYRAGGVSSIRRLLAAGRSDTELYGVLGELLGLTPATFDAWWHAEVHDRVAHPPQAFWPQPN